MVMAMLVHAASALTCARSAWTVTGVHVRHTDVSRERLVGARLTQRAFGGGGAL